MRILVLGAGVVGISAAYELAGRGHEVTVIDRGDKGATETSFANGGQLSYSHAEPWANPGVPGKLPKWLFRSDAPLVFRPRADLDMITWGLKFLRNCTAPRAAAHCIALLRLGLYSRQKMHGFAAAVGSEFDYLQKGILHIYSTEADWQAAIKQAEFQGKFGGDEKTVSARECLEIEPALEATSRPIVGGILAHVDESGDAFLFTNALIKRCEQERGVKFHFNTTIQSIEASEGRISHVVTGAGDMQADAYVLSAGSYSPLFLKKIGIRVPIYPMKGYSITLPFNEFSPSMSITDGSVKLVYSKLGARMRVAGTAEFAGYNDALNEKRITPIVRAAKKLFPKARWEDGIEKWACLRPSTPDGPPILGHTPYPNLFLNTGHGTLGWTQAAGSAHIVADLIDGKKPEIALSGLTLERYLS